MFDLSPIQLVLVLIIALLVLGPRRLPEVGRTIGRTMREVRGAISLDSITESSADRRDEPPPAATTQAEPAETADPPAGAGRPVAVGGNEFEPPPSDERSDDPDHADQPSGSPAGTGDPSPGPAAKDMVVRGPRAR